MSLGSFVSPLTSFVGRAKAITTVADLLDQHRMVTITGSGGCGKTRLALEVASAVEPRFDDGGAFVDLAPIDSPAVVASVVAAATDVASEGAESLTEVLGAALAPRHLLLLLDNCDQVAEASAALVHYLLVHCSRLVVLATSRSPVGVDGEVTWRVPSLSMPAADAVDPVTAVQESEAGQLLLDRARLAVPGFELTPADAPAATRICRRLDGIPLAIELAASRLRAFDVTELAVGLENRFRLLTAGMRTAPPRQRTLEASIDWSHDLLDPSERVLFRRLGVFAGRFTLQAAETVCADGGLDAASVRVVLAELVDRSLLHVDETVEAARYRLLETVREYALLRLVEAGEGAILRDRHLDHILAIAARFDSVVDGATGDEVYLRVEAVIDDVRAALQWSMDSGRIAEGLRIAADLRRFWINRNRNHEGRSWLESLLALDDGSDVRARTRALLAAAHLCLYAGEPEDQERLAGEALTLVGQLDDRGLEAHALLATGWAKTFLDPASAPSLFRASRQAAEAAGDPLAVQNAYQGLGWATATAGDLAPARDALSAGVAIGRQNRSLLLRYGLTMLGYVDILQGRLMEALAELEEAASWFGGDTDLFNRDRVATWVAFARMYQGAHDEARERLRDAIASARAVGNSPVYPLIHLGLLERAVGNDDAAVACLEEARPMLKQLRLPWFEVQALVGLGDTREAMTLAEASGNALARTVGSIDLARSAARDGDRDRSRSLLRGALKTALRAEYRLGAIDALEALAVLAADDRPADAGALLAAVDAERARTGYARFPVDERRYADAVVGAEAEATSGDAAMSFEEAASLALGGDARPIRPASGWESLTPAEVRVALLVAEGLSNPEIGERLFISRRTVQAHLGHIFSRLGVKSRSELAAAVSRRQSTPE